MHHQVLEIIGIDIFFRPEEAMFENWQKHVSLSNLFFLRKFQSYIVYVIFSTQMWPENRFPESQEELITF